MELEQREFGMNTLWIRISSDEGEGEDLRASVSLKQRAIIYAIPLQL